MSPPRASWPFAAVASITFLLQALLLALQSSVRSRQQQAASVLHIVSTEGMQLARSSVMQHMLTVPCKESQALGNATSVL